MIDQYFARGGSDVRTRRGCVVRHGCSDEFDGVTASCLFETQGGRDEHE
jgi:hypothetical protein